MDRVRCACCGQEHDLSEMEPGFDQPDAYFQVPPEERAARVTATSAATCIRERGTERRQCYLRGVLVIPVRGERDGKGFGWGVWAQVSEPAYERCLALGELPERVAEPPFSGTLANEIASFPGSRGLPVRLRLQAPGLCPHVEVVAPDHPLGADQREGVYPERVLEWLGPFLHA